MCGSKVSAQLTHTFSSGSSDLIDKDQKSQILNPSSKKSEKYRKTVIMGDMFREILNIEQPPTPELTKESLLKKKSINEK